MTTNPATAQQAHRLAQAGRLEEAVELLRPVIDRATICLPTHGLLAILLCRLGRMAEAEAVVTHAVSLAGGVADAYDALANVSMVLGRHDRANALYKKATEIAPSEPRHWYNLACSERSLGRLIEAEAACDQAIALDATQYPTYLLRSELRVQGPGANHVDELKALLVLRGDDYRASVFLGYALAKELDDLAQFDEAFHWFSVAASARRARLSYDVATDEAKLRRVAEVYAEANPGLRGRASGPDSSRHVFIVGLPRSGTTLVERILTGLEGVRSNGETDNFSRALLATANGTGDVFARAAAADPAAVAAHYERLACVDLEHRRIVEKLPLNYLYLGAIARALPQSTLLLVTRSPLDSCFAMYRTLFGAGYPFSYDLQELGRYYVAYDRLIGHWRSTLGQRLHEVAYEQLVRDPRTVGSNLAAACGLAWQDSAIEIQRNQSVSLTASAAQVRRPIYGSSSGRWRHYGRHLQPLIATLRAGGVAVPDDASG
jgi:hypothetical protein